MEEPDYMGPIRSLLADLDGLLAGRSSPCRQDLQTIVDRHKAMTLSEDRRHSLAEGFDCFNPLLLSMFDEAQTDGHSRHDCRGDPTDLCIANLRLQTTELLGLVFVDPQPLIDDMFDQSGFLENRCSSIAYERWRNTDIQGRKNIPKISQDAALEVRSNFRQLLAKHGAYTQFLPDAIDAQLALSHA